MLVSVTKSEPPVSPVETIQTILWIGLCLLALVVPLRFVETRVISPVRQIRVQYISPVSGASQMFYSPNGEWTHSEQVAVPTFLGWNDALYRIPAAATDAVRWDPANGKGRFEVIGVQLVDRGVVRPISFDALTFAPGRFEVGPDAFDQPTLIAEATSEDPQVRIDLTGLRLTAPNPPNGAVVAFGFLLAATTLFAAWKRKLLNPDRSAIVVITTLYLGFVAFMLDSVPRLPFRDDWRYVVEMNGSGKLPLSVGWLFSAHNDTVYATPKLIDVLVLNTTNFSFYALQIVGLLLLSGFLVLAMILHRRLASRVAPASSAPAVLILALSLMAPSFWPRQAVTYHHMLPLVIGLGILVLLDVTEPSRGRLVGAGGLALLAGFSYVSGALMVLAMGLAALLSLVLVPKHGDRDWQLAGTLTGVGVFVTFAQLLLISRAQGSVLVSSVVAPIAMPWSMEFWGFAVGIVSRAIGKTSLPTVVGVAATAVLVTTPFIMTLRVKRSRLALEVRDVRLVLFAALVASVYLGMIAAGRGGGLGGSLTFGELVEFGSSRFHFWWVSALMPFVWLGWSATRSPTAARSGQLSLALVTALLVIPATTAPWQYGQVVGPWVGLFDRVEGCFSSHEAAGDAFYDCGDGQEDIARVYDRAVAFDLAFLHRTHRSPWP